MIKKISFLCITILLIILSSCQNINNKFTSNKGKTISISFWHYYSSAQKNILDKSINKFNETEGLKNGIFVEAKNQGSIKDLEDKIIKSVEGQIVETMPDIFTTYSDLAFIMDSKNKLATIEDYLTQAEIDEYVNAYIDEGRLSDSNKIKIFPIAKATEGLYINQTDWNIFLEDINSNPDYDDISEDDFKTWEDISKISDIYYRWTENKTPDIENDGKSFFGIDSIANFIIISNAQLGIDIIDSQNNKTIVNIDEIAMKKVWDIYYKNMISGRFAQYGRFRSDDIKTGDLLAAVGSTSSGKYFPTSITINDISHNIELLALSYPNYKNSKNVAIQQGAGIAVSKSTVEKEEASILFLKWFADDIINTDFALMSGYIPVKKSALKDENISEKLKISDSHNIADKNNLKILNVAVEQVKNSDMYFVKPSEKSFDIRRIMEKSLIDVTNESIVEVKKASGKNREKIINELSSDEKFELWIEDLKIEIDEVLKK